MSEPLTRAMRTDDGELLFSDYFNGSGSADSILFPFHLFSFSTLFFNINLSDWELWLRGRGKKLSYVKKNETKGYFQQFNEKDN